MAVSNQVTILYPYAKVRPIVFDNDNTSMYEAAAEAVHARYAHLKGPDNLYGGPSGVASGDMRAFNGGRIIVPPQTAPGP